MRWSAAIDTSRSDGGIAFGTAEALSSSFDAVSWGPLESHDSRLAQEFAERIERFNLQVQDLAELAVVVGPGRFTGLRVGIAFAKALSWHSNCAVRCLTADQTWALTEDINSSHRSARYIEDAQSGFYFVSDWSRQTNGDWECVRPLSLIPGSDLDHGLATARWGAGWHRLGLGPEVGEGRRPPTPENWFARRHLLGQTKDWKSLEPLYFRRVAAEEKRDRVSD